MKRLLTFLTVLFATLAAFAQGDSPYARFGYEGKVLRTPQERQQRMMLVVPNPDTTATVARVGLDPAKQRYYLFDKENRVLDSDTLAATTVSKFLSVDPLSPKYAWYTPYQFAGNKPIQFVDIDGLEEGFDIRSRQMEMGYLKGTVSEKELREFQNANGRVGIMGLTGLFDVFVTKGWLTRAYLAYTLGDAIDNGEQSLKARNNGNPAAAAYYRNKSRSAYTQFGVGIGLIGITNIAAIGIKRIMSSSIEASSFDPSKLSIENTSPYGGYSAFAEYDNKSIGYFSITDAGLEMDLNIDKSLKGKGIGTAFFNSVMKMYKPEKFIGTWVRDAQAYEGGISDNLRQYEEGIRNGLSEEAAAFGTWSGKRAAENGFKHATVKPTDFGHGVQATFTK